MNKLSPNTKSKFNKSRANNKQQQNSFKSYDVPPCTGGVLIASPIPERLVANYSWSYIGTALSTISDDFNFVRVKLNSVYDCGGTLTSSNVNTQLGSLSTYRDFLVTHTSIQVDVVNLDTDVPLRLTVVPTLDDIDRSTSWTSDSALIYATGARSIIVGNASGFDKGSIKMTCDIGKLSGVGQLTPTNYEYSGFTGANIGGQIDPVVQGSWVVAVQAVSSVTDNIDVVLSIKVVYRTMLYSPIVPIYTVPTLSALESLTCKQRHELYLKTLGKTDLVKASSSKKSK